MDPNVTLEALRKAMKDEDWLGAQELFAALDSWLNRGGFLPDDWEDK